jgi:hypothetical protein
MTYLLYVKTGQCYVVRISWCYDSIPPYRARLRDWRRQFRINRLAAEYMGSTNAAALPEDILVGIPC